MLSKRLIAKGAALCACAVLMNGISAVAEERRLGDFIYVPAMQVTQAGGSISLRVDGLALQQTGDEPVVVESLAGVEFGVYVISGSGEVTPWANPLYPSEQMRIRTGEGETRFTLPQGAEYYLRQESAPAGYLFDSQALIPVTGGEIVVSNKMAGELVLRAMDSLGTPLSGVEMTAAFEDGTSQSALTDENGEAVFSCASSGVVSVREGALPEGVFDVLGVSGGAVMDDGSVQASVEQSARTRVTFEHQAAGTVQMHITLRGVDENAEETVMPLEHVRLSVLGDRPASYVTDAQGMATGSLLEGTYSVELSYEGDMDVVLPISAGQMVVQSGSTTLIELSAVEANGRISLLAAAEKAVSGGSVSFVCEETGKRFGPYALDSEGMAVSDPLPAGTYHVDDFVLPDDTELDWIASGTERAEEETALVFRVEPGLLTQIDANLLTRERQTFEILIGQINDQGEMDVSPIGRELSVELCSENGETLSTVSVGGSKASIEALSGSYTLKMDQNTAAELGVQAVSDVFALPSPEEAVVFASERARLILSSVDENGVPASGAVYAVTDSSGSRYEVVCDSDGIAVTPLLFAGEATIETIAAPDMHDVHPAMSVTAEAGKATGVAVEHPSYGWAVFSARVQSLDEQGNALLSPLDGMQIELYRVSGDSQQMTDMGVALVSDEQGMAQIQLEPGEYVAMINAQDLASGWRAPQALRFVVENTQRFEGDLVCMDALGGVRVMLTGGELDDMLLAQVRFELVAKDGATHELTMQGGAFYAGGLASGNYVLRQTQIPQGYTLAAERTVAIAGGEAAAVDVPLEEYALLSVSKTGLTFDDALKTYIVPLCGEYGVFTMKDGEMKPYPSAGAQMSVWANVSPEQIAQGKLDSVKLPASIDGTTYYLHEISGVQGFAADETYYEVKLHAGEEKLVDCAVSSDRGFVNVDMIDASTGMHVPGGAFELADAVSGETVLSFTLGDAAYRNPMAIPVGEYVLRQLQAADGYALSSMPEVGVVVEPYLTQGGTMASVTMTGAKIPDGESLDLIADLYTVQEQGLTMLTVDAGQMDAGETLLAPATTIRVSSANGERTDIASVVIAGTGDAAGGSYLARVEYCLAGGGWQPSDARITELLVGPTAVSLTDVQDDISAVKITYIDAETGREAVRGGFTPGQTTLSIEVSADARAQMTAEASFEGQAVFRTALDEGWTQMRRMAVQTLSFEMQGDGLFETVSAGRDGSVSGVAFFDENADGVMDREETGRYAGMTVSLMTESGDVVESVRTGADGSYAFDSISSGNYQVQFDAGDQVVYSSGRLFSEHAISRVEDMRYGMSDMLTIDGDHTDYVVNVGCIYAAGVTGAVLEQVDPDTQVGFGGLSIEMRSLNAATEEEPMVVLTDDMGMFSFARILPGAYEITIHMPEEYLCKEADCDLIVREVDLSAGETNVFSTLVLQKEASLSGEVRVDDDGDGVIAENALGHAGVRVALLRSDDGYTQQVAETTTDENGAYAFEHVYAGEYSVLFELDGEWAFTRYGEDSDVYGAVSQSGSTKAFALSAGEHKTGVNAGVTIPAQMSVTVFKDTHFDGQMGAYEETFPDVTVSLIRLENGEDAEEISYKTDAEGTVVFAGVSPGEYVIAYQLPGQWRATRQIDDRASSYPVSCVPQSALSSGRSLPFTLSMGQSGVRMYIGAMLSCSVSGMVYYDDDADASRGEDESPAAGVDVQLLASDGSVLFETETADDGTYAFEGLTPARYRVRFIADEGCGFSGTERTMSRGGVQESDEHISETRSISVTGGASNDSANAGIVRLASLSGSIWEDRNADTRMDDAERMMSGVTVNLMDGAGRIIKAETTTDEQGRFTFSGLRPDTYMVRIVAPEDYVFSGALEGSVLPLEQERDGRGYSAAFSLLGGANVQGIAYGLLTQGSISGVVWEDTSYDGVPDEGEGGLRGVKVTLLDAHGNAVSDVQTIRSGEFVFDHLMPGEYSLIATLQEGYLFTTDVGEAVASPDSGVSVRVPLGMLEMGGSLSSVQIGALKPASVGGYAWIDHDNNGRRESGSGVLAGIHAQLTMLSGADAGKVYETTTDETGAYAFESVMPGEAMITFTLPQGYAYGRQISGASCVAMADSLIASTDSFVLASGDEKKNMHVGVVGVGVVSGRIWEDSEYNGKLNKNEAGVSGAQIELIDVLTGEPARAAVSDETGAYLIDFVRAGEYSVRVTLPQGMIFTKSGESAIADIDQTAASTESFVLEMGASRLDVNIGAIVPAGLSGAMLIDENENGLCDDGEPGCEGVTVTVMQGGTALATAATAQDGTFAFDLLRPGTYRLRYTLDDDTLFVPDAALKLADPDASEGETGEYPLAMGQIQTADPVPVVRAAKIAGRAWMDEDVDGRIGELEPSMTGVTVELLGHDGERIASCEVDEEGRYAFSRLRSGAYTLAFTLPQHVLLTDYTADPQGSCVQVVPGNVGRTDLFELGMGEQKTSMNIGGILPGEIGDTVWLDKNGNGLQDYKEPLVPGVSLTLMRVLEDGTLEQAAAAQSDQYGYYKFKALRPGSYVLCADVKEGDVLTFRFGAPLGEIDSDVDPETGMSEPFVLMSGQTLLNVDVGFVDRTDE